MSIYSSITNIGNSITLLQSVESTNNYAMGMVHAGLAKHGESWFALEQTAGRGQRGRSWKSDPGQNIIISVVLEPAFLSPSAQFPLSMCIALGCFDLFSKYAGDETKIKWPNDLYWRDRKAGGILIENVLQGGEWRHAIAGIGININQTRFGEGLLNPVSLKQITGKDFDPFLLAKELCDFLDQRYRQVENSIKSIANSYNQVLYKRDQTVKLVENGVAFEAVIKGVSEEGKLIIDGDREFSHGQAEWVIPS